MFRFSLKVEYAIKALVRLGVEGRPMSVSKISAVEGVPFNFLEQIFVSLRRAKIVKSIRGKKGGYVLAKPPADISVLDVVRAVEGEYGVAKCMYAGKEMECAVPVTYCILRRVWDRLQSKIEDILSEITIESIISEAGIDSKTEVLSK